MTKKVKTTINAIAAILFLFVLMDHFLAITYKIFLKDAIHSDLSLYIEIVSVIFTISVPFFYSQYQRRENQKEEIALKKGGNAEDLKKIREINDFKSITYYSLMVFFVILLAFVQSNIIISSQMKTSNLQAKVLQVQLSLTSTKDQLNLMVDRLSSLDSALNKIANSENSLGDVNHPLTQALSELKEIHTLTSNIENSIKKTDKITNSKPEDGLAIVPQEKTDKNVIKLQMEINDLKNIIIEKQEALIKTSKQQYDNIESKIYGLTKQISTLNTPPNNNKKTISATLTNDEIRLLEELTARYYEDFVARYGKSDLYDSNIILNRFNRFSTEMGVSLSEIKQKLDSDKDLIDKFLNSPISSENGDLIEKLKWLLWLRSNIN